MNKRRVIFIAVFLLILLVGTASAWVVLTPLNRRYEAMWGGTLVVTNSITITDTYFDVSHMDAPGVGTSRSDPVYFGTGLFAITALTTGDWIFAFTLNTTVSTPANSVFEVKLDMHGGSPFTVYNYALYVATGSTVQPNATILCLCDLGATFVQPLAYKVTVQKL